MPSTPLRRIGLAALLGALCACKAGAEGGAAASEGSGPGAAESAAPAPPGAAPPRRPTRRYYLARSLERCVVYSVDGDAISPPFEVPCPQDLARGERLRIAGKTCARESPADPARESPVVCPDPLTNLEKDDIARDRAARAGADGGP